MIGPDCGGKMIQLFTSMSCNSCYERANRPTPPPLEAAIHRCATILREGHFSPEACEKARVHLLREFPALIGDPNRAWFGGIGSYHEAMVAIASRLLWVITYSGLCSEVSLKAINDFEMGTYLTTPL
jgi:hypothetical protein